MWPSVPTVHPQPVELNADEVIWLDCHCLQFRVCSYCGSIHPEDLLTLLSSGGKLEPVDVKYGWPGKLYVSTPDGRMARWYTAHLLDEGYGDVERERLLRELQRSGIEFTIADGRVQYRSV